MLRLFPLFLLVLVLCPFPAFAQDGQLQQAREAMQGEPNQERDDEPSGNSGCSCPNNDNEDCGLGQLFGMAILTPFWLPHVVMEDDFEYGSSFHRYPYADDHPGYLWVEQGDGYPGRKQFWAGRLLIEEANDFDGLNRVRGSLFLDTVYRVGLQTNWDYLHERLGCGCTDEAVVSDTNLTFRFAQQEWGQMYAGVGFRMWNDRADSRFGWNFVYGGDFFPVKPLILSTVLDAGTLGEATVFRARGTAGIIFHGWELFGGYDFLRIGDVNIQGPMIGLRFWF